jgi:PAS domain S-box-containing protein
LDFCYTKAIKDIQPLNANSQLVERVESVGNDKGEQLQEEVKTLRARLAELEQEVHEAELEYDILYKEAQEAIQQGKKARVFLTSLLNIAPMGLAFIDSELRYLHINETLAAINRYPAHQHLGKKVEEIVYSELRDKITTFLNLVLTTRQPILNVEITSRNYTTTEKTRYYLSHYYPIQSEDEEIFGIGLVVQDITERKRSKEEGYNPKNLPDAPPTTEQPHPGLQPAKNQETILLVEDEKTVRDLVTKVLKRSGYEVMAASNGQEALDLLHQSNIKINLVLTDVVMPKMGGMELSQQLEQISPGMPILFMSGYTDGALLHSNNLKSNFAFLQKPFTPQDLAQKLRELLD